MANNRYFLYCPCGSQCYIGKSLGNGIYNTTDNDAKFLRSVYNWMWEHIFYGCDRSDLGTDNHEWFGGEVFKVLTEYDERIK